jgi:uncharacterized protein (DUF362 family)
MAASSSVCAATPPSAVRSSPSAEFRYEPPAQAGNARRILLKPNLGYPLGPPVTVSMGVLARAIAGLRRVNPSAEILIVEGVCSKVSLDQIAQITGLRALMDELGDNRLQLLNADALPLREYPNLAPEPVRFRTMWAPQLLAEVDCRISIGTLKQTQLKGEPLISASLKNLYGLFPRSQYRGRSPNARGQLHRPTVPLVLRDIYGCIGHLFDGAVVDGDRALRSPDWKPDRGESIPLGQVFWGDDAIAVDREACRRANLAQPSYLAAIDQLRPGLKRPMHE